MELERSQVRKRNLMMIFGAFAIFFTGYPHVWSLYQPYVMDIAGWSQTQASMCFYLSFVTFVFGNIFGGRLQDRYSPKIAIMIGGGIFASGVFFSAFLILPSPVPMYLTYGIMQGFGQGMIYTTIISTAQKWFPHKTGFASGVVVTANGLCGFFLAPFSRKVLSMSGPKTALMIVGIAIAVSWIFGIWFIRNPEKEVEEKLMLAASAQKNSKGDQEQHQYTSGEMIRTKKFYLLVLAMLCGLMSYFMVSPVSQIIQSERGISVGIAASAVMFGSVVNAIVRLLLPTIADKAGRTRCVKGVTIVTIAAMILLVISKSYITTAAIIMMYGCYGGIMGSFPSLTSSIFGLRHSGENYGIVMSGIVIASLGAPAISGAITGAGSSMNTVFKVGVGFAAAAFVCIFLLEKELKKEKDGIVMNENKEEAVCQL